jgi:hypothetical protein
MKKITLTVFWLTLYFVASAQLVPEKREDIKGMDMPKKDSKQQAQPTTYTCPMHPEIHATKPGNCPKCGMKLTQEKPKAVAPKLVHKQEDKQLPKSDGQYGYAKSKAITHKNNCKQHTATNSSLRFIHYRYHSNLWQKIKKGYCSKWANTNAYTHFYRR